MHLHRRARARTYSIQTDATGSLWLRKCSYTSVCMHRRGQEDDPFRRFLHPRPLLRPSPCSFGARSFCIEERENSLHVDCIISPLLSPRLCSHLLAEAETERALFMFLLSAKSFSCSVFLGALCNGERRSKHSPKAKRYCFSLEPCTMGIAYATERFSYAIVRAAT